MYLLSFFEKILTFVEKSSRNFVIRQKKRKYLIYIYNKNKVKTDAMYEKKILDAL